MHLADTFDHTANHGLRYIVNPPGSTVRVHQHAEMGRGEVNFDEVFTALAAIGFDRAISGCVFGWDDQADEINVRQRDRVRALVRQHFPTPATA